MKDLKDEIWKRYDENKYKTLFISNYGRVKYNDKERTVNMINNVFRIDVGNVHKQLCITKKMKKLFGLRKVGVRWIE